MFLQDLSLRLAVIFCCPHSNFFDQFKDHFSAFDTLPWKGQLRWIAITTAGADQEDFSREV
jgi:hypothetical protein